MPRYLFADFETYYDTEYSLKKMTPVEYILDGRFEALGCAFKDGLDGIPYWVDGEDLPAYFKRQDPNMVMVSHNALFDQCIVSWVYGFQPKLILCTLAMTRAVAKHKLGILPSLSKTAKFLGLPDKGGFITKMVGVNRAILKASPSLYEGLVAYALNDVDLCASIFKILAVKTRQFPAQELLVLDNVLRAATEPQFELDVEVLMEHLQKVVSDKEKLLVAAGVSDKAELMSNDKFAALLQRLGVTPPTKISKTTGKGAWAFSKQDLDFLKLEEHEDITVQAAFAARIGNKTTLEETRTARMIRISHLSGPHFKKGSMPMPLRYSAAHTHRLGGDWQLNVQNLPRTSPLRRALRAPRGKLVVAVDSSQIEARLVATTSGATKLIEQFANKEDVYATFASLVFGFLVDKMNNPTERFVGKQGVLGLGYGLGHINFARRIQIDSKNQTGKMIVLSEPQCRHVVNTYRKAYDDVPKAWRALGTTGIAALDTGNLWNWGPVWFGKGIVYLPNGMKLRYRDMKWDGEEWSYDSGYEGRKRLYGGKIMENVIQALARIITMDAGVRIRKRVGPFALQSHDELVYVVDQDKAEETRRILLEEIVVPPTWLPNLPLGGECKIGATYADAK